MIKRFAIKTRLWMLNGRGPVLDSRNYVPGLMEFKLRAAQREG